MSTASTPRSTRSASPENSPNMLTPGQKIKAMMAQFGSDSESDSEITRPKNKVSKLDFGSKNTTSTETKLNQLNDSSDDEDDIVQPKGRMAARMQGDARQLDGKEDSAFARLSKTLRTEREQAEKSKTEKESTTSEPEVEAESSEDGLPAAAPRRRKNSAPKRHSPGAGDRSRNSTPRARSYSPLFVSSPAADEQDHSDDADGEIEQTVKGNARFLALVAQKRKEREEREKIEEEKKAARKAQMEKFSSDMVSGEESEAENPISAHKLSQKARQPRKASKKALDEMRQETQRMSRNMQLAHQAQTKKKITKESFFAKFGFGQAEAPVAEHAQANSSSTAGSQQSSDAEVHKRRDTPHTSPLRDPSGSEKPSDVATAREQSESNGTEELTSTAGPPAVEKVPAPEELGAPKEPIVLPTHPATKKEPFKLTRPPVRVLMSRQEIAQRQLEDSDSDDLEVVTSAAKSRGIAAFENLPAQRMQESASMIKLKALAHLTSPTRKSTSMTSSELSADLLFRARQQAAKERQERIEELRAKGVVIETAEERAAMEDDMEDLVEKARREADEIKRLERAAKKNGDDPNDEDDDDYELSGSEDEAQESGDEDEDARSFNGNEGLIEQEAGDGDESSDGESEALPSDVDEQVPETRRKRPTRVVSDDEDEEEAQQQVPSTPVRAPSNVAQSAERPRFLGIDSPIMSMGLTQAFAGTLADDDDGTSQPASATLPFSLPDPGQPVPRLRQEDSEILVRDSQEQHDEPDFMTNYHQNVTRVSESPAGPAFSQYSQLPDPTQDEGFVFSPFDPNKRFRGTPPVSTVDTVIVGQSQSPIVERKSRQLRRGRAADLSMVVEEEEEEEEEEESNKKGFEIDPNAFNIMKKAAKKPTVAYDKKNSKAKNVVDEAAEESEDEYAGLGGASDDSDDEENAYDKQMINDNSGETVDEKELAALNAVHDRNRDEKDVAKLLKDITTGALRRRRGGGDDEFDLDDSDDEHQARRREKQREFAKMRKALLADDKIGELAENPKKAAFFRALEDRDVEDDFELEFLEEKDSSSQNDSQGMTTEGQEDDPAKDNNKRKRPLEPSAVDVANRPPPNLRRTPASAMSKKPATLAEIRESLSFLTETPEYDSFHEDASVDEDEPTEGDDSNASGADEAAHSDDANSQSREEFAKPSHPRRTRGPVVDRLALLRQASSNSATVTTGSGSSKLAFQTGGNSDGPIGFRPPKLLHRISTGSSTSSNSSTTSSRVSKPAASGPKKGGAVNSYTAAREKERERQLRVKQRNGSSNVTKLLNKHAGGGLGALAGKGQWD
ncbi:uncharacterized protein N7484_007351 [Penicillium longicatenatum]|uniref:uncharacterized protein n=1 Tax=Penicillium longicatenatum TaxID=1561947 RepID=UPI002548987E|nr:uncharacterized protein N7484_007351 [Penicillium longicatenatum]KAJ5639489.1 hypothetical protein N7484_007351 [Penicillium longicatenatum]